MPHREAGVPVRPPRWGGGRHPDPARVRGGTGRLDPVRSRPEAQSAGLSPGPDGGQPVRSDREFLGILERAAAVAPGAAHWQPRQARNEAGHGGGGERNPGRDHPAARCLVHEGVPDLRCPHARRHRHRPGDTALYDLPPLRTGKPGRPRKYGITKEKLNALPQTRTELPIYGRPVRYRTAVCMVRFLRGRLVRVVWVSMFVDGKWKAERLLLSTDWSHTAEDVIFTYSLRWTIEPMFAALKWSEGMIDMWMQSVETFHRWLNIVQIGRALIQMLAVKADAATTALAQVAAWRKEPYLTAG